MSFEYVTAPSSRPLSTQTNAFWNALKPATPRDFEYENVGGVRCVKVTNGSCLYHGYGGEAISSRRHLSGVTHVTPGPRCSGDDTRKCYGEIGHPFADLLQSGKEPFAKGSSFFVGPKTTADKYGLNKNNTEVVRHRVPSKGIHHGERSETDHRFVDLYQIPRLGGVTIQFKTKRDAMLVDIGHAENGEKFVEWAIDNEKVDNDYAFDVVFGGDQPCYRTTNGNKVERNSTFDGDSKLVDFVKKWCASLSDDIDGFFWGGSRFWPEACEGLHDQEFCFFAPSGLLVFEDMEGPIDSQTRKNLPTFDEFFENAKIGSESEEISPALTAHDERGFEVFRYP